MRRYRRNCAAAALTALAMAGATPGLAWWPAGHSTLARAAVRTLPEESPAFFRQGEELIAHLAQDPDVAKNRDAPLASNGEFPEHFIDLELLQGRTLPANRYAYLKLCRELGVEPDKAGTAPYAIAEWTERLAVALAEHRRWPENRSIQTKALVYAGILSHYATDVVMPLHTTIHYDGRVARPGDESPHTGIHSKVDSLIERLDLQPEGIARNVKPSVLPELLPSIAAEIQRSHLLVDLTYRLEPMLPPARGEWTATPEIRSFTEGRAREAARFLGSLYLTAWNRSQKIRLPEWLKR